MNWTKKFKGREYNALSLNDQGIPWNPVVNAGAIAVCSLINTKEDLANRFEIIKKAWKKLAGGIKIGFDNATYQYERKTGDR